MKIETLDPLEITPTEPPRRPETVESLCVLYSDPGKIHRLPEIVPYVFVHYVKGDRLYQVDGHHRTGVAHMHNQGVHAIFLQNTRDFDDACILRDEGKIPHFESRGPFRSLIPNLSHILPGNHLHYAASEFVFDFDDFVEKIRRGEYSTDFAEYASNCSY